MKKNIYRKMPDVTLYYNGDSEIRLRKGIWNFEEVTIDLGSIGDNLRGAVKKVFECIEINDDYSMEEINKSFQLTVDEYMNLSAILEELFAQSYLCDDQTNKVDVILKNIIGGSISKRFGLYQSSGFNPILLICDNKIVQENLIQQGKLLSIPINILADDIIEKMLALDITNTDPITAEEKLTEIVNYLDIYPSFLIVLEKPNMKLLRSFNRALKQMNKSATLIMLDGPFITFTTVKLPETGCFECLENRVLARMEDMSVYQNFVAQAKFEKKDFTFMTPIINTFASLGLQEMLLILATGKSKFVGRVMSIYLPLFEIQIQDLLRIPVCPACGMFGCSEFEEMYTSTQNIVEKLIDKVSLTKSE